MIVFNSYFEIVKKYVSMIIMYTIIFTMFAVVSSTAGTNPSTNFTASKPSIAIINNDEKTVLLDSFTSYIKENANIVDIDNNKQAIKDALFFREVTYVLIIPDNFTNDFMQGLNPKIETMRVPGSYESTYLEMLLNRFLNIGNVYASAGMSEEELSANIIIDLKEMTKVTMLDKEVTPKLITASYYYNFSNYTLLAICVLVVGMIMQAFNNRNIKRRNIVSSIPYKKISRALFLGHLSIMLIIWLLYVAISFVLYGDTMLTAGGLLIILNSFFFSITVLAIGFLIGSVFKNRDAIDGVVNIIALGSSFICGAFVPQELLGDFVLGIAKVFPSYWYIKNNNDIVYLSTFDIENLQPIFTNMGIVILYAIIFFGITNMVNKYTQKSN